MITTPVVALFAVFVYRTWRKTANKRRAFKIIVGVALGYWMVAGLLSFPLELAWHGIVERRFIATHDYLGGFNPFTPPELMDFTLRNGTWVESSTSFFYLIPCDIPAKPGARQVAHGWILALWAFLAVGVHALTIGIMRRALGKHKGIPRSFTHPETG